MSKKKIEPKIDPKKEDKTAEVTLPVHYELITQLVTEDIWYNQKWLCPSTLPRELADKLNSGKHDNSTYLVRIQFLDRDPTKVA